jgi:hypothetical protein
VTADPLSAQAHRQVHSQAHAWGALPKHLTAAYVVASAVNELELVNAELDHAEAPRWT